MPRRNSNDARESAVRVVLRTLGVMEGTSESAAGGRLGRFGPGKPLALLVYLAHSPNRGAPRDHLVELLWSDVDPDAARHALRQTIWYVRRTLGDGVLGTDGDVVRLAAGCDADALDFLRAVDEHDEDRALALYAGDFLPALAIPGGAEFERWADLERLRLRAIFTRTAEARVLQFLGRGEARLALPVARRARDVDPLDERLWRRLLEVHIALTDVVGAAAEADAFERLWNAEERAIDAATRTLLRRARSTSPGSEQRPGTSDAPTLAAALVGRVGDFAALTGAWDDVQRDARARHIHLTAPAGLGKTRLLSDFRSRLRASRSRVVLLRANPGERALPYALISTLAQALAELPGAAAIAPAAASVLVRLNPALSSHFPEVAATGDETEALRRRTVAVRELAAAVSDERAVAVLVDDLHWADRESLAVLAAVAGNFGGARVLLVTSARGGARQWFAHEPRELALQPLDPRAVTELVSSLGQLPDAPWAEQFPALLLGATSGSPLLVLETLQLAMERDLLCVVEGAWVCLDPTAMLAVLLDTNPLAQRVGQLDTGSRQLLALLSASGVPCSPHLLAVASGVAADCAEGLLQALEVRGMAQRAGEHWMPAHDEIAAAMLATLDDANVARCRLAVARAVVRDPAADLGALRLAAELLLAGGDCDELAELFARFSRTREAAGVRASPDEHLRALTGDALPSAIRRRLLRSVPWRRRMWVRQAAVAALVLGSLGALGAMAWWRREPAPALAMHLFGLETDSATVEPMTLDLPASLDLSAGTIELSAIAVASRLPRLNGARELVPAPDGSGWYAKKTFSDGGGDDVVFVSRDGTTRRVDHSAGDDGPAAVSPDGSRLAINTTRFSREMHSAIALLDVRTHRVTPFSPEGDRENLIAWHPDGSHVLVRRAAVSPPVRASSCVLGSNGTLLRCLPGRTGVGWGRASEVLVMDDANDGALEAVDITSGKARTLCSRVRTSVVSPDGSWILVSGERSGWDGTVYWLAPISAPCEGAVLLRNGSAVRAVQVYWDILRPSARWIERVIARVPDSLTSFAPVQLSATGVRRDGGAITPALVQWASLDTSVAAVTSDGLLVPRTNGIARVVASAGGWRADTAAVVVAHRGASLIRRVTWSSSAALPLWYAFGTPLPTPLRLGDHSVLSLNGDSSFSSGIRLRQTFPVSSGLALRVRMRLKVTADKWQNITLGFGTASADAAWEAWDKMVGPEPSRGSAALICQLGYPAGEGTTARGLALFLDNATMRVHDVPDALVEGRWVWIEVQLLPDGRCGVGIDGTPKGLSRVRQPTMRPVELKLNGYSHRTQTLLDTVEVYSGVLHPAWWSALDAESLQRDAAVKRTRAGVTPPG